MLTSITPLGQRGRRNTWLGTVVPYVLASAAGGATTGAGLGALGGLLPLPGALRLLAAAGCVLAAAADLAPRRLPGGSRQVNEDWLTRYRGWVYGAGFGWQLGTGVLTVVTSASTYALLLLLVLTRSPEVGAAVGTCFGLVRALPVLAVRRVQTPQQLRAAARRLEAWARPASGGTVAGLLAAAAVLVLA